MEQILKEIQDEEIRECFKKNFAEHILDSEGNIDIDALAKELSDYSHILKEYPRVLEHATGTMSKVNYFAVDINRCIDDNYRSIHKEYPFEFICNNLIPTGIVTRDNVAQVFEEAKQYFKVDKNDDWYEDYYKKAMEEVKGKPIHPDHDILNEDKVFVENSDGSKSFFLVVYDNEAAAYMLIPYTNKHFEEPEHNSEGKVVAEFLYSYGFDLLQRVEDFDIEEL